MNLTIAYMTARKEPKSEWFFASLGRELEANKDLPLPRIIVVDFYHSKERFPRGQGYCGEIINTNPKPCIWQGEHRLTRENWFAASNARNTALCLAPDGWIVYVDDLSVLMPGWLKAVRDAMSGGYIALGAYKKVKNLVVENGEVKSYEEFPGGIDSRWRHGDPNSPVDAAGSWMFGCSVALPVEALLTINGWPEDLCDGLSGEDYCCGIALQNAGYKFKYDLRMLTLESEEHHHIEPAFRREDWHFENGVPKIGGNGADDKSHAALNIARQSTYFQNSFGEGDIGALRQRTLMGFPFPIPSAPEHDWFTKLALKDL